MLIISGFLRCVAGARPVPAEQQTNTIGKGLKDQTPTQAAYVQP